MRTRAFLLTFACTALACASDDQPPRTDGSVAPQDGMDGDGILDESDSGAAPGDGAPTDGSDTEMDAGPVRDAGDRPMADGGEPRDGAMPPVPTDIHAQVLQHCPYAGWHINLAVGDYTRADLEALGFRDNDASSLRVSLGYEVVLYEDDGFQGATVTVDTHQSCLTGVGFNDKVSSLRLRKKPNGPEGTPLSRQPPLDVTFFAVSDTHADPPGDVTESALRSTARAINKVAADGVWPTNVQGDETGFTSERIGPPEGGIIFTGDLIGYSNAWVELPTFERFFFPQGTNESVQFPGYVGLGNHDLADPFTNNEATRQAARDHIWNWVSTHHQGPSAPAPVTEFDPGSRSYAWTVGGVHFVQLHRFPGDDEFGHPSNMPFLQDDLETHAADGKPVFLFHHYGFDPFGAQDRWWTPEDRMNYALTIAPYNVGLIVAGHWHEALPVGMFETTNPSDTRVLHVNDIKLPRPGTVQDGNGSFSIVRVTDREIWVVNCRWLNENGDYELIRPFYRGPTTLLK